MGKSRLPSRLQHTHTHAHKGYGIARTLANTICSRRLEQSCRSVLSRLRLVAKEFLVRGLRTDGQALTIILSNKQSLHQFQRKFASSNLGVQAAFRVHPSLWCGSLRVTEFFVGLWCVPVCIRRMLLLNALPPLAITTRKLSVRMGPLAEMRNERIHTQAQMGGIAVGCIAARILMTTNIYIYTTH